jgi:hypothetical protein
MLSSFMADLSFRPAKKDWGREDMIPFAGPCDGVLAAVCRGCEDESRLAPLLYDNPRRAATVEQPA